MLVLFHCCRARLLVKKEGQFFTVEDREQVKKGTEVEGDGEKKFTNDILYKPRVKTIQNIKSVLGELVACAVTFSVQLLH